MISAQGLVLGQSWPKEFKNSKRSASRRLIYHNFSRFVETKDIDPMIEEKLTEEAPAILVMICVAYKSMLEFMKKNLISDLTMWWHYSYDENLASLGRDSSPLQDFLESPYVHIHSRDTNCPIRSGGCFIPREELRAAALSYARSINKRLIWNDECQALISSMGVEMSKEPLDSRWPITAKQGFKRTRRRDHNYMGIYFTDQWFAKMHEESKGSNFGEGPSAVFDVAGIDQKAHGAGAADVDGDLDEDQKLLIAIKQPPIPPYILRDLEMSTNRIHLGHDILEYDQPISEEELRYIAVEALHEENKLVHFFENKDDFMPKPTIFPVAGWEEDGSSLMKKCKSFFKETKYGGGMLLIEKDKALSAAAWLDLLQRFLIWERYHLNNNKSKKKWDSFTNRVKKLRQMEECLRNIG